MIRQQLIAFVQLLLKRITDKKYFRIFAPERQGECSLGQSSVKGSPTMEALHLRCKRLWVLVGDSMD